MGKVSLKSLIDVPRETIFPLRFAIIGVNDWMSMYVRVRVKSSLY